MAEKLIRFRSFHFYVEKEQYDGAKMLGEQMAFFGQKVDIPRKADIARGEELGAFFSDEEAAQIEAGTYTGPEASLLAQPPMVEHFSDEEAANARVVMTPVADSGEARPEIDMVSADAETIASYIEDNKLNVADTVALAGGNSELAEKVYDAENLATDNEPRKGVTDGLDAIPTGGN